MCQLFCLFFSLSTWCSVVCGLLTPWLAFEDVRHVHSGALESFISGTLAMHNHFLTPSDTKSCRRKMDSTGLSAHEALHPHPHDHGPRSDMEAPIYSWGALQLPLTCHFYGESMKKTMCLYGAIFWLHLDWYSAAGFFSFVMILIIFFLHWNGKLWMNVILF